MGAAVIEATSNNRGQVSRELSKRAGSVATGVRLRSLTLPARLLTHPETRPSPRRPAHPGRRSRARLAGSCRTGRLRNAQPSASTAMPPKRTIEPMTVANTARSAADIIASSFGRARSVSDRRTLPPVAHAPARLFLLRLRRGGCGTGSGIGNGSVSFSLLSLPSNSAVAAVDRHLRAAGRVAIEDRLVLRAAPRRVSWPGRASALPLASSVRPGSWASLYAITIRPHEQEQRRRASRGP